MFVDRAVVAFIAGRGGDGCIGFRREKFVPMGGPNGGDGGDGGSIILKSSAAIHSLIEFKGRRIVKAEKGQHGSGSNKMGRRGKQKILMVPLGTVVKTFPDEELLFDFSDEEKEFVIARGGKGGLGNVHFKSSVNQAPRKATPGKAGETIKVVLELKLIAFAGLVGFPNAGKSTLISKITQAKPKIANYPFTTLIPNLGVMYQNFESLVIADIPGLIEGAHRGQGMGIEFLRHIERTRLLVFLIDISPQSQSTPLETLKVLQQELRAYQSHLLRKAAIVVANKIDMVKEPGPDLEQIKEYCAKKKLPFMQISALKGTNLAELKRKIFACYNEK